MKDRCFLTKVLSTFVSFISCKVIVNACFPEMINPGNGDFRYLTRLLRNRPLALYLNEDSDKLGQASSQLYLEINLEQFH